MITTNFDYKEYKTLYYKTDIVRDEFIDLLNAHLCDEDEYESKTTVHSSGLFFERKKRSLTAFFSTKVMLVFSQRSNYSVMSVTYSVPVIVKYYRYYMAFGFISLIMLSHNDITILKLINLAMFPIFIMIDIILYMVYKVGSRDINAFFNRILCSSEKINYKEYQNFIGED